MDYIIYGIMAAVIAVMVIGTTFVVKAANKKTEEAVSALTNDQKKRLWDAKPQMEGKLCWKQEAMIADAKMKGANVALYILYANKTIQNNTYDKIIHADVTVRKAKYEEMKLVPGTFIVLRIDAEKCKATVEKRCE